MSDIFRLNWKDISGAVLSAVIVAVLGYVSKLTSISAVDPYQVLNIAALTGVASLLKALGTNVNGEFLGAVKVK